MACAHLDHEEHVNAAQGDRSRRGRNRRPASWKLACAGTAARSCGCGAGGIRSRTSIRRMVEVPTRMPGPRSSPWIKSVKGPGAAGGSLGGQHGGAAADSRVRPPGGLAVTGGFAGGGRFRGRRPRANDGARDPRRGSVGHLSDDRRRDRGAARVPRRRTALRRDQGATCRCGPSCPARWRKRSSRRKSGWRTSATDGLWATLRGG